MPKDRKKAGKESADTPDKKPPFPEKSNVAIIGGGIAGITAAIKLYRQGYKVTLFEKSDRLGGNMSSDSRDDKGDPQDVYPHIFADWYHEFWYLLEQDLEIPRGDVFAASKNIHLAKLPTATISKFKDVKYATLATPTNLENVIDNLQSGAVSGRDMLLYGYSFLDLVSIPSETSRSKLLNELDVNGHLYSRPYMNNAVADLHDDTLKVIWSVPSEQTSAVAYQKMLRHSMTFPKGAPFAWFLKGPLHDKLMQPIEDRLSVALGDRLKMECHVTKLDLDPDDEFAIVHWQDEDGAPKNERYEFVIMATPADVAADLAIGSSLAKRHPLLARLREAQAARIPVVHLYFNQDFWNAHQEDFENVPKELVGFRRRGPSREDSSRGSTSGNYDISMLNISAVWDDDALKRLNPNALFPNEPVLFLAASQAEAIAAPAPSAENPDGGRAQAIEMIRRLKEYYPFIKIGAPWDEHSHIDWGRTRIVSNSEHLLFLNTVSANQWRPNASLRYYRRSSETYCKNVIFAGDYCMTPVDMATVEAATQSGVLAARALMNEHDEGEAGLPVQPHPLYTSEALVLAKLLSTPAAFAAALTAIYDDAAKNPRRAATLPASAAIAAASYWSDWMRSAEHLVRLQMPGHRRARFKEWDRRDVDPADESLGVLQMAANAALALAVEGQRVAPALRESVIEAMYQGWHRTIGRVYFPDLPDTMRSDDDRRREFEGRTQEQAARASANQGPDDAEEAHVPSTWSDLFGNKLDGGTVATAVGSTAFGMAAAGAKLIRSFSKGRAAETAPGESPPASLDQLQALIGKAQEASQLGEQLKDAMGYGVAASERRATGYRYYKPPRAFPKVDPPSAKPDGSGKPA